VQIFCFEFQYLYTLSNCRLLTSSTTIRTRLSENTFD